MTTGDLTVFDPGGAFTVESDPRQGARVGGLDVVCLGGQPIDEPVAWHGSFVMNPETEIQQAYDPKEPT